MELIFLSFNYSKGNNVMVFDCPIGYTKIILIIILY